jgi:hypothetical protein
MSNSIYIKNSWKLLLRIQENVIFFPDDNHDNQLILDIFYDIKYNVN